MQKIGVVHRAVGEEQQKDADQKSRVTDAVGDEGFHSRRGFLRIRKPETDQ